MISKDENTSHDSVTDFSNRVDIFRKMTVNQVTNEINSLIFEQLLDSHYDEYLEMCDYLKNNKKSIKSVSCYLNNGKLNFDIIEEDK